MIKRTAFREFPIALKRFIRDIENCIEREIASVRKEIRRIFIPQFQEVSI